MDGLRADSQAAAYRSCLVFGVFAGSPCGKSFAGGEVRRMGESLAAFQNNEVYDIYICASVYVCIYIYICCQFLGFARTRTLNFKS